MNYRRVLGCLLCFLVALSSANASWTDGGGKVYQYTTKIPINYTESGALADFPVLVTLTPANFSYSSMAFPATGQDLRFINAARSTTELPYEIDGTWVNGGTNLIWVKVDSIASATPTAIYAVYGCAGASAPAYGTTTWSAFKKVLHFKEGAGTSAADSSPSAVAATLQNGTLWETVNGKIGSAVRFDGINDQIAVNQNATALGMNGDAAKTSEAWVKVESGMTDNGAIFSMGNASTGNEWTLNRWFGTPGWVSQHWNAEVTVADGATAQPDPYNNWVHVAHTYTPGAGVGLTAKLYINGVQAAMNGPATLAINDLNAAYMGVWYTRSWLRTYFKGYIDEGRLANVARSAGWLRATYLTVADPTFSPTTAKITQNAAANITASSADLSGTLNWPASPNSTVHLCWGDNDGGTTLGGWDTDVNLGAMAPGAIPAQTISVSPNNTYYYRFYADDGTDQAWAPAVGTFDTAAITIQTTTTPATEAGLGVGVFTLTRGGAAAASLTVSYTLTGTATAGSDFQTMSGTATFAPGSPTATITITPIDDVDFEPTPETVICTIQPGTYIIGTPSSATLTITSDDPAPASGFRHRMPITLSGYTGSTTLNNFPVLVKLSESIPGFHYSDFASPTGGDLRFTDSTQAGRLSYEIEKWNPLGTSYVWVKVPAVSGVNTKIYAYWGNPDDTAAPSYTTDGSTWSATYGRVYHLDSTAAGDLTDSCKSGNNLTVGGAPQNDTGPVVGAVKMRATALDYLTAAGTGLEYAGGTSVEFWYRADGIVSTSVRSPIAMRDATSTRWSLHLKTENTQITYGVWNNAAYLTSVNGRGKSINRWYHVTAIESGSQSGTTTFYVDGEYVAGQVGGIVAEGYAKTTGKPLVIGMRAPGDGAEYFLGAMDEVRISPVSHSADWILANYKTQSSDTFLTFGTKEDLLASTGATGLSGNSVTLNAKLTNPVASSHVYLCWGDNDNGTTRVGWDNEVDLGTAAATANFSQSVSFPGSTTYYYRFVAESIYGTVWTPADTFAPATVSIAATDGSASEDGPGTGTLRVTRTGVTDGPLTVRYTLSGAAVNGTDYTALSGEVTFATGETTKDITVTPLADNMINEGAEPVTATLVHGGYELGTSADTVTIADSAGDTTSGWAKSMDISFPGYTGGSTLQNFPVLVKLSENIYEFFYTDFGDSAAGGDLRFTDEAGTQWLPHEIDRWKDSSGTSYVWVKLPTLSGTTTKIKAYWGNPGQTTKPAYCSDGSVWSENYAAVYHFSDNSNINIEDSSTNHFTFDNSSGAASTEEGKVGRARGIANDGVNPQRFIDSAITADALGIGSRGHAWTVEALGLNTPVSGAWKEGALTWIGQNDESLSETKLAVRPTASQFGLSWSQAPDGVWANTEKDFVTPLQNDTWYHVAGVHAGLGTNRKLYIDGITKAAWQTGDTLPVELFNNVPLKMGFWQNASSVYKIMNGKVDEVRISTVARSDDWLKASADTIQDVSFATYPTPPPTTVIKFR